MIVLVAGDVQLIIKVNEESFGTSGRHGILKIELFNKSKRLQAAI
jgi:hypothetical protein